MVMVSGTQEKIESGQVKPCPFCGGTDIRIETREFFDSLIRRYDSAMLSIGCADCGAETCTYGHDGNDYDQRRAALIAKWNTRRGEVQ